ncbi:MAG: nickel-dependent lactate racemase [Chloroflexi bacterium]|nr:nickel-dependent lactate racemase [Chloroflexota bacterium]MCL5025748.1 nickel-dependent lactate racemase [Chloroflexota bacterium]
MSSPVNIFYKGQREEVVLPSEWRILATGEPKPVKPLADVSGELRKALDNPVGMASLATALRGARTVTIVVDDQTRVTPCDQMLPELLSQIKAAGIGEGNIQIVMGKGTHRWPSEDEVKQKVGADIFAKYGVTVHDPDKTEDLKFMGTTSRGTRVYINRKVAEADFWIGMGTLVGHYFAGYGGGPKIVLPGVSGRETIVHNHVMAGDESAHLGNTTTNKVYLDMLETAKIARIGMKIDVILNMDNQIAQIVAGEVEAAHKVGIDKYNAIYGFQAPEMADVTVVSGYPLESELLQSCKAIVAASQVTKKGGTILVASECTSGAGPGFDELMKKRASSKTLFQWIGEGKASPTGGPVGAHVRAILEADKKIVVVTDNIKPQDLEAMELEHAPSLAEAVKSIASRVAQAGVIVLPAGSSINPY